MEEKKAPFPEYFRAEDHGKEWHLFCLKCGKGWALEKTSEAPGNLLALLNHARGCEKERKPGRRKDRRDA